MSLNEHLSYVESTGPNAPLRVFETSHKYADQSTKVALDITFTQYLEKCLEFAPPGSTLGKLKDGIRTFLSTPSPADSLVARVVSGTDPSVLGLYERMGMRTWKSALFLGTGDNMAEIIAAKTLNPSISITIISHNPLKPKTPQDYRLLNSDLVRASFLTAQLNPRP